MVRAREYPDIFVLASRLGFFLKSEESLKYQSEDGKISRQNSKKFIQQTPGHAHWHSAPLTHHAQLILDKYFISTNCYKELSFKVGLRCLVELKDLRATTRRNKDAVKLEQEKRSQNGLAQDLENYQVSSRSRRKSSINETGKDWCLFVDISGKLRSSAR